VKLAAVGSERAGARSQVLGSFQAGRVFNSSCSISTRVRVVRRSSEVIITAFVIQDRDPDIGDAPEFAQRAFEFCRTTFYRRHWPLPRRDEQAQFVVAIPFARSGRVALPRAVHYDAAIARIRTFTPLMICRHYGLERRCAGAS